MCIHPWRACAFDLRFALRPWICGVRCLSWVCQRHGLPMSCRTPKYERCQAFVMPLSGVCHAYRLTPIGLRFILPSNDRGSTKLVLENLTEKARAIEGFKNLPVTAQISLLYNEIEAARLHSIPLSVIQEHLSEAGSSVSLRYLRQALSVVRARLKDNAPLPLGEGKKRLTPVKEPQAPTPVIANPTSTKTPKEAREQKADAYTTPASTNPLLRQHRKGKE